MQCPRCQHENPPQAKFCLECGARQALTCSKCRAELPGSAKFCLECGEPVGPQIQSRSPDSYTPKHLAEKILTSKAALEGSAQAGHRASIAYQVIGQGPPDLIWCIGSYSHLDLLWEDPVFARTFERLGETARLLLFDKRGIGLSDRTNTLYTLEERIDDIRAVLDAAESRGAYLMGFSEGGAMAGLFAATSPERTEGLILYGASAAYARKPDWPYGSSEEEFEAYWRALRERTSEEDFTTPFWQRWLGPALADDTAFLEWWRRLRRSMGSPAALYAQARMNRLIDVRPILPSIRVPTLIMVREDDPNAPVEMQRWIGSQVPNARLVILPGRGHLFHDIADEWVTEVEQFLTGAPRPVPTQRFLTTLVSADIVGSTK